MAPPAASNRSRGLNVAQAINLVVLLGVVLIVAILVYISIHSQNRLIEKQENKAFLFQYDLFQNQLQKQQQQLLSLGQYMVQQPALQQALQQQDRNRLQQSTSLAWQGLQQSPGLAPSSLAFFNADNQLLYQKTASSQDIPAPSAEQVQRLRQQDNASSGLHIQGTAGLAMHAVAPVTRNGAYQGSLVLTRLVDDAFFENLMERFEVRSALFLDSRMAQTGANPKGRRFIPAADSGLLVPVPSATLATTLQQDKIQRLNRTHQGNSYAVHIIPVKNSAGQAIGAATFYIDRSKVLALRTESRNLALAAGIILALLGGLVIHTVVRYVVGRPIKQIMSVFHRIGQGDYSARSPVKSHNELGEISAALNSMLDEIVALVQTKEEKEQLQNSIMRLLDDMEGVADGDLTHEAQVSEDAMSTVADSFNLMLQQLRELISDVHQATEQVSNQARQVHSTAQHLAQENKNCATQITSASSSLDEMAASIQQVSENAAKSSEMAQQFLDSAQRGNQAVKDSTEGMNRIRSRVQDTSHSLKRLGESTQEINEIVQLIHDIADRTSILALNASIQAAMAGDAGRGFSVVAEEVERLAERASNATNDISQRVTAIQNETQETMQAMEESTQEVVKGSEHVNSVGQAFNEIETVSQVLAELIDSISHASQHQTQGSESVAQNVSEIAEVIQQTAAGSKQASNALSDLTQLSENLRASMAQFKLPADTSSNSYA